ncbi:putative F-box protein At5g55150 [Apium graveolens]|uniref:putative F-box protein At5g55150 n=1 Tax=Apium graveolens TaxID=4045 RepID=UPI003D7A9DDB
MFTFARQPQYDECYTPRDASEWFIKKVAMSFGLRKKDIDVSSFRYHAVPSPIVMAIYGGLCHLGTNRDEVWTDVNVPSHNYHDIVYHRGIFYAVDCYGGLYVCCSIDHDKGRGPKGTKIASIRTDVGDQKYLVKPLSGSGLLLLVRHNKIMDSYDKAYGVGSKYRTTHLGSKYRTTHFDVWRLDLKYCDSLEIPSCTLTEENSLGNEAIFVGRGASFSVPSSKTIKPNSIYFMDDKWQSYRRGGGCDMGIFDIEHRTIEPHFEGKPLDCISPPPPALVHLSSSTSEVALQFVQLI